MNGGGWLGARKTIRGRLEIDFGIVMGGERGVGVAGLGSVFER